MVEIAENGIITLTRGDTLFAPLFIDLNDRLNPQRYYLKDSDVVYLGVTEPNQKFEDAIIKKVYTKKDVNNNGDVVVNIKSTDTEYLEPGVYYYQIKLETTTDKNEQYIATIVTKRKFIILD